MNSRTYVYVHLAGNNNVHYQLLPHGGAFVYQVLKGVSVVRWILGYNTL